MLKVRAMIVNEQFDRCRHGGTGHCGGAPRQWRRAGGIDIAFTVGSACYAPNGTTSSCCRSDFWVIWQAPCTRGMPFPTWMEHVCHHTGASWQVLREAEKALKMSQRKDYYKIPQP